jgi:hypothetical protein
LGSAPLDLQQRQMRAGDAELLESEAADARAHYI